jgi:hypothetical protein
VVDLVWVTGGATTATDLHSEEQRATRYEEGQATATADPCGMTARKARATADPCGMTTRKARAKAKRVVGIGIGVEVG